MTFFDVVRDLLGTSRFVLSTYLSDMTDEELLVRPVPGAHHAAWQLGHLILSERMMIDGVEPKSCPAVSPSFLEAHGKGGDAVGTHHGFLGVKGYLELMTRQREVTLAVAERLTEARLDEPAPEFMRSYAPFVRSVFLSIGGHEYMHAGQLAVIRRHLGKPVLI